MGDLTTGQTFHDFDTVGAADLNNAINGATLNSQSVTSGKIAAGAIQQSHLSSGFSIGPGNVLLPQNNLLAGNSSGAGTAVALGTGLGVNSGSLTLANVDGNSLAQATVAPDRIAATGVYAVTYGSRTRAFQGTVTASGQFSNATVVDVTGLALRPPVYPILLAVPDGGNSVSAYHGCVAGNAYEFSATANLASGSVSSVTVNSGLPVYLSVPAVSFVGGGGSGATAAATLKVGDAGVQVGGSNYRIGDTLSISGNAGTQAVFTVASVGAGGCVTSVTFAGANAGSFTGISFGNPTNASGGNGTGCRLNVLYAINSIQVTHGGTGYTSPPVVVVGGLVHPAAPDILDVRLRCIDSGGDAGYAQGDEVNVNAVFAYTGGSSINMPFSIKVDTLSVTIRTVTASALPLKILSASGGDSVSLTASKWNFVIRPLILS